MGWDCYATQNGRALRYYPGTLQLRNKTLDTAFRQAAKDVRRLVRHADCGLEHGMLGLRECADMLHRATGLDPYTEKGWTPEDVQKANWNFDFWKSRRVAYWSARKFLETCDEHHLGVKFSY